MMKFNFISSLLLLFGIMSNGQDIPGNMQKQLDELKNRVRLLEKENESLKAEDKTSDSAIYASIRSDIFIVVNNASQLYFDIKNTSEKVAVTGLFTKLIQASNPTSDILGFRFSEIILSSAEKNFLNNLKDTRDKKRFCQVISKIVDNQVVSALANTNPVTSVVAAIISTIAGFTTSSVALNKEGGRVKDVTLEQQDAIDNKSITAFRNELQVYIDFYDAMILVSNEFLEGLDRLDVKHTNLLQSVAEYRNQLYTELNVDDNNLLIRLSELLPDPSTAGKLDFGILARDPRIRRCHALTSKYPALSHEVSDFKRDYNMLLFNFLTSFSEILEKTGSFPDTDIDKSKTEDLIREIDKFLQNLEH